MMRNSHIQPAPTLRPYIAGYWMSKGYISQTETIQILPDGSVELILCLGEDVRSESTVMEFGKPYIISKFTQVQSNYVLGDTHLLGITFKPGGFSYFYKQDAMYHYGSNNMVEFDLRLFPDLKKLMQTPADHLNRFFLQRLNPPRTPLQAFLADIHQQKGQTQVAQLCKTHFVTERNLERHFKKYLGCSPKAYINLVRFQHAFSLIRNNSTNKSLMDIAFEAGYYDHAHLVNDFRRYTANTPTSTELLRICHTVTDRSFEAIMV